MSETPANVDHIYLDLDFSTDFEIRTEALERLDKAITDSPSDTRNALAGFTPVADEHQRRVIDAEEQTIRLVAPAGSGKTATAVNRVLRRMRDGLHPRRILVLTFDNAAASSIRTTLQAHVDGLHESVGEMTLKTLNAFGLSVLRDYAKHEAKEIVPDWRRRRLFAESRDALKEKSLERHEALPQNVEDRFFLDFFSLLKNELFDPRATKPQEFADFMQNLPRNQAEVFFPDRKDEARVRRTLEAMLWLFRAQEMAFQREKLMDFDDQKLRAYVCMMEKPELLAALQAKYGEVIVDEFQDINKLDFAFVKALAAKSVLVVIGDDDQAIYGFRGCTPDYIIDLERHLGRPITSYELRTNYRCPPNIVDHSTRLIRRNKRRIPKTPIAASEVPAGIKVISTLSAAIEAKTVVKIIKKTRRDKSTLSFKDFVVLYRTNAQSLPVQVEFILNDIPYYVRDEDNILRNEALDRLLGVLRTKLALGHNRNPTARDAVLTLRAYFRYLNARDATALESVFERGDFMDVLGSERLHSALPKSRNSSLEAGIREMLNARTLMDTLDVLSRRFRGLQGMIGSLEEVVEEKVPLGEIYELAANFKGDTGDFLKTMEQALEHARKSNAGQDRDNGVGLLTYFRSKGLQWHTVILTTCNEGLIPHKKAERDGKLEDERRLFYVAMTRASANLVISYVKSACGTKVLPSRFLSEAGLIVKSG